jgi:hypothetical protein
MYRQRTVVPKVGPLVGVCDGSGDRHSVSQQSFARCAARWVERASCRDKVSVAKVLPHSRNS